MFFPFLAFFYNSPYGVCDSFSDMMVLVQLPSECSLGFSREEKLGLKIRRTLIYVFIFLVSPLSRGPPGVHFLRHPPRLGVGSVNNLK